MFLRNYDNLRIAQTGVWSTSTSGQGFQSEGVSNGSYQADGIICIRNASGGWASCYPYNYVMTTSEKGVFTPTLMTKDTICLGTGDAEVTYDDYKLSGNIISNTNLVYKSMNRVYDDDAKCYKKTVTFTYANNTNSDITIKEWGMFGKANSSSYSMSTFEYSNSSNFALFFREVLAEPITIEAGTTGTLTFEFEVPQPAHS